MKKRRLTGNIVKVPLGQGRHAYGWLLNDPLVGFFDGVFSRELTIEEITARPLLFKVWAHRRPIASGEWPVVGRADPPPALLGVQEFSKQDAISGELHIYRSHPSGSSERPASAEECEGLERAAVWDADHVVGRLLDHEAGRDNPVAASLRIDPARVPRD